VPQPAVLTEQLTRVFGSQAVVDHVDLAASIGAVYGILGPMGAGKTTLVRLLLGLVPPTSGSAWMLGYNVRTNADSIRARTGVVLQSPGLYENLSAIENLDLYARIWHLPATDRQVRIRELLQHLDLWERRNERVCSWSQGMKHKLAILRALVHRPSLLILDEPTASLDAADQEILRADLTMLAHQEGASVLITTRDPWEATLCDQIAIIHHGRIVASGSPQTLADLAAANRVMITGTGFTKELVELVGSRQDVDRAVVEQNRLIVEVSGDKTCAAIVNLIVESGADVDSVTKCSGGLETTYRSLVEKAHEAEPVV
jgi:ABC-2 type transport system ATP-binding protein